MSRKNKEYVKKRKSYYGFAREYPGKIGSKTYIIGDSVAQKRRETIRKIILAVLVILLFIISFIITSVGLNISEKPITNKKTVVSITDTAVFLYTI